MSVALGTHNGAEFLGAQLQSILDQTVPVDEVVLSDDASGDGTVDLAVRLVGEHRARGGTTELRVIRNETALGVTANFEQALRLATGAFVALSDQDDVWRADRIETALARFAADARLLLVASDADLIDDDGAPIGHRLFELLGVRGEVAREVDGAGAFASLLRRNLLTGATMMVRRDLVDRAAPFPESWVHDEWLAVVAAVSGGVGVVGEPLVGYRQHGGNQIGVTKVDSRTRLERLRAPRTVRNARLLARAIALADRLEELGASEPQVELVRQKVEHERIRSALPEGRLRRVVPVVREFATGRYGRFGRGAQDVLRDLVQPV